MKNTILIALFILGAMQGFAQESFIGQNKVQVRDYWATKMSDKYFGYGFSDESDLQTFYVMRGDGPPEFNATFERSGKCIDQYNLIKPNEIASYEARFKKLGFTYNETRKRWEKACVKYIWRIENKVDVAKVVAEKI